MATAAARITSPPRHQSVADLLDHLHVPPQRIRLVPPPGTATEDDVVRACNLKPLCELIDGVLVEKTVGYYESRLAVVLIGYFEIFLRKRNRGFVLGADGLIRVNPNQVRLPDVSFFLWKHFPGRLLPQGAILDLVPDLAVEVLSPDNTLLEMARKRREYFDGGAQFVWEVDPEERTVHVYTSATEFKLLREKDTLVGGKVLPDFKLKIKDWFARAGKRRK